MHTSIPLLGGYFFWIEVFIDSFAGYAFRKRSTTGVYASFSNIRSRYRSNRDNIYTLMLLPPRVSLYEALAPLRRDLHILERGLDVMLFDGQRSRSVRVWGAVSVLVADHVQACHNCNHLGNTANKNCRFCFIDKEERMMFDTSILSFQMTRTLPQMDAVREQMSLEIGANTSASALRQVKTKYGVSLDPLPFGSIVDPFQLSFPCVGHALDLGLMCTLLTFLLNKLNTANHITFVGRMKALNYPRGWTKLSPYTKKLTGKLSEPMKIIRKLSMFSYMLFTGLVPNDILNLTMGLLRLRGWIMQRGHDADSIQRVCS